MRCPNAHGIFFALAGLATGPSLMAQGVMDTPDKWRVSLGWQFTSLDTQVAVSTQNGVAVGTKLDFENTFDVPVQKQAWALDASWRYAPRHIIDFGYQSFDRTGGRQISTNINFGDYTFSAGGQINARFKSNFPYVGYRYGFYQGGDLELSVGGGITYMTLGAGLDAAGSLVTNIGTGTVQNGGSVYGEFKFPAPLMAFQIDGRLTPSWLLSGYLRPIYFKSPDFKGGMNIWGINATWYCARWAGLSLGFESTRISAKEVKTGNLEANFTYVITGAKVAATFRF